MRVRVCACVQVQPTHPPLPLGDDAFFEGARDAAGRQPTAATDGGRGAERNQGGRGAALVTSVAWRLSRRKV